MMRVSIVLIISAISSSVSIAQYSKDFDACSKKANTQDEMHVCASEEALRADREMNITYRQVLATVSNEQAAAEIRASQEAWMAYRDAYMQAMFPADDKIAEYGTLFFLEVNLVRADLTRQHTRELTELLKQHNRGAAKGPKERSSPHKAKVNK